MAGRLVARAGARAAGLRLAPRARLLRTSASPTTSFIDKAKVAGANALLGQYTSGGRFDNCLSSMTIDSIGSGKVTASMVVEEEHSNHYGTLHGGLSATIVDIVGTIALLSQDATKPGVSVDINVSYLSAAKVGASLEIEGRVLKSGRSLGFTDVTIRSEGKVVATGRHTKAFPRS